MNFIRNGGAAQQKPKFFYLIFNADRRFACANALNAINYSIIRPSDRPIQLKLGQSICANLQWRIFTSAARGEPREARSYGGGEMHR